MSYPCFTAEINRESHRSTCPRHPNDAAVPAPYLTRLGTQTYATTYAYMMGGAINRAPRRHEASAFGIVFPQYVSGRSRH
ncbi:hypothetical protein BC2230_30071 [Burkholderia cepacia]